MDGLSIVDYLNRKQVRKVMDDMRLELIYISRDRLGVAITPTKGCEPREFFQCATKPLSYAFDEMCCPLHELSVEWNLTCRDKKGDEQVFKVKSNRPFLPSLAIGLIMSEVRKHESSLSVICLMMDIISS